MTTATTVQSAQWMIELADAADPNIIQVGTGNQNEASINDEALENFLAEITGVTSIEPGSPRVLRCQATFPAGTFSVPGTVREIGWKNKEDTRFLQRTTYPQGYPVNSTTVLTVKVGTQERPAVI